MKPFSKMVKCMQVSFVHPPSAEAEHVLFSLSCPIVLLTDKLYIETCHAPLLLWQKNQHQELMGLRQNVGNYRHFMSGNYRHFMRENYRYFMRGNYRYFTRGNYRHFMSGNYRHFMSGNYRFFMSGNYRHFMSGNYGTL